MTAASATTPTVSVVIPTRGRRDRIVALAQRVLAEADLTDLVIVTGKGDVSVSALAELAEHDPRLRLTVVDPPPSAATARLAGARAATGDVVLLLDDDVWPAPGVVAGHARYHRERDNIAVVGTMPVRVGAVRQPGEASVRLYAEEWEHNWAAHHDAPLAALWMGHLSLRRDAFIRVEEAHEGWDDAYHEDTDLGLRLARAGLVGIAADDLRAEHLHHRILVDVVRDAERQVRGLFRLIRRHPEQHGELPAHMTQPTWLYAVSRVANQPRVGELIVRVGVGVELFAGRRRMWRLETAVVRLVRRIVAMAAVRRIKSAMAAARTEHAAAEPARTSHAT